MKSHFPSLTGSQIEEAFRAGLVLAANGKRIPKGHRFQGELEARLLTQHVGKLRQGNSVSGVEILHECEDYWVVDKPAGVPCHPISLFDSNTLTQWALATCPEIANEFPQAQPALTPHRLDTGTSGVVIVNKTRAAFDSWRADFEKKKIRKVYLAWCWGKPKQQEWEINLALAHDARDARKMVAPATGKNFRGQAQSAQSLMKVLHATPTHFLAQVQCYTGVTHQVRAHLALSGFPLIGDKLYDDKSEERKIRPEFFELRATELETPHGVFRADGARFSELYRS